MSKETSKRDEMNKQLYLRAARAMQTGVAVEMNIDPGPTTPKHLRVGVNSALVNDAALARLLVEKGIITESEYLEAVRKEMEAEVERARQRLIKYGYPNNIQLW